jgi:amino acid transporter
LLDIVQQNINSTARDAVSLGVAVAIFNAVIASALTVGRVIFSSARDRAWPAPVNRTLSAVHGRLRVPWIATLLFGGSCAIFTALSSLAAIVTFTSVVVLVLYVMILVAALVSRVRQRSLDRPWKMPLWPLPPLLGLVFVGVTFSKQKLSDVWIVAVIVGVAVFYWILYLRRRREDRWLLLEAADTEERHTTPAAGGA